MIQKARISSFKLIRVPGLSSSLAVNNDMVQKTLDEAWSHPKDDNLYLFRENEEQLRAAYFKGNLYLIKLIGRHRTVSIDKSSVPADRKQN